MAFQFRLPDIGEGIHEGEIVKWFVKPGDKIQEDDVLCEVQNDKAVVEIPSPVEGTVEEILVQEGTVAVVGDVLVTFDAPGYEDLQFKGDHGEERRQKVERIRRPRFKQLLKLDRKSRKRLLRFKKIVQKRARDHNHRLRRILHDVLSPCLLLGNMHANKG